MEHRPPVSTLSRPSDAVAPDLMDSHSGEISGSVTEQGQEAGQ